MNIHRVCSPYQHTSLPKNITSFLYIFIQHSLWLAFQFIPLTHAHIWWEPEEKVLPNLQQNHKDGGTEHAYYSSWWRGPGFVSGMFFILEICNPNEDIWKVVQTLVLSPHGEELLGLSALTHIAPVDVCHAASGFQRTVTWCPHAVEGGRLLVNAD